MRYWQHGETGRVTATEKELDGDWYEIEKGEPIFILLHCFDKEYKALCGASWEYGRNEKDFLLSVQDYFPPITKCITCLMILEERKLDGDKPTKG